MLRSYSLFNKGNIVRCEVLKNLGYNPGNNLVRLMKNLDELRILKAEKAIEEIVKKSRQKARIAKSRLEDEYREEEGEDNPSYAAGQY